MKKRILFMMMVSSTMFLTFTACKTKTAPTPPAVTVEQPIENSDANSVVLTAADIANNITVPTFENPDVTKFCLDFKSLMVEYATYKGSGDATKSEELEKKFNNWAGQATQLAGKIKPNELDTFNDFITQAQAKFKVIGQAPTSN
ncbi:MAG TPA: hypothetical protein VLZ75_14185 [Chitinophagales bacterium]|nr:hypothetical protein [Chitinophagales bacterium]